MIDKLWLFLPTIVCAFVSHSYSLSQSPFPIWTRNEKTNKQKEKNNRSKINMQIRLKSLSRFPFWSFHSWEIHTLLFQVLQMFVVGKNSFHCCQIIRLLSTKVLFFFFLLFLFLEKDLFDQSFPLFLLTLLLLWPQNEIFKSHKIKK